MFGLEQALDAIAHRRRRWRSWQGRLDAQLLVFSDVTWIKTNMALLRGWDATGNRLRGFGSRCHWRTSTFLGALRHDRLAAPCVFDGPVNGECFRAYVEQQLAPFLRPGDNVLMDNLGIHKSAVVRRADPVVLRKALVSATLLPRLLTKSNRPSPKSSIGFYRLRIELSTTPCEISGFSPKTFNPTNT